MRKGFYIGICGFIRLIAQNTHHFHSHAYCSAIWCFVNSSLLKRMVPFLGSSETAASLNSFCSCIF